MRLRVSDKGIPTIIRYVQPLVSIRGPRIGQVRPMEQGAVRRAGGGPQTKRAIHVHPGAVLVGQGNHSAKGS